jgi:hypothetical protein
MDYKRYSNPNTNWEKGQKCLATKVHPHHANSTKYYSSRHYKSIIKSSDWYKPNIQYKNGKGR